MIMTWKLLLTKLRLKYTKPFDIATEGIGAFGTYDFGILPCGGEILQYSFPVNKQCS